MGVFYNLPANLTRLREGIAIKVLDEFVWRINSLTKNP
jgi:hypothetical protein